MRLPRDLSGAGLAQALRKFGYEVMRLTTRLRGEHHITVPQHSSLQIGTLAGILSDVAQHFEMTRPELIKELFEK